MSQNSVQLTHFQVERLQCIGGEGRAAPYRITTYQGQDLGIQGKVIDANLEGANGPRFELSPLELVTGLLHRLASGMHARDSVKTGR
jgi:hypothetical protein